MSPPRSLRTNRIRTRNRCTARPQRAAGFSPRGRTSLLAPRRARVQITVNRLSKAVAVSASRIIQAARAALAGRAPASLNVALVDDATMCELHQRFMGDPRPTDVLSFDLREDNRQDCMEGEIVVSLDTARRQARQFAARPADEVLRYVIHGVLHLVGYDDHTPADRRRMRLEEDRVLNSLSGPRRRSAGAAARSAPRESTRRA